MNNHDPEKIVELKTIFYNKDEARKEKQKQYEQWDPSPQEVWIESSKDREGDKFYIIYVQFF
tara:strand:- start:111 stop:296 length:186 start_codon:yes stop_codon:yes gene_type:complete